ncbi:ATP-binding cassette domain-containing protein [Virgibacillus dokdonensis]|uniref:ATP-binding cassette domain-containing protein n=1 Tax=Virgibacillus dokdonensis TaxID=302167 RepID=UPI0026C9CFBD|nr:ATP-binding cassette domain-containing protein [Virgibacillus dokdonensis]
MEAIVCEGLTKKQKQLTTLKEVSFSIPENTIVGVVGRNGAGKTTLLKILAGLWRASAGNVHVLGENPFNSLYVSTNTIYISNEMVLPNSLSLSVLLTEAGRFYPRWNDDLARRLVEYFGFRGNDLYTQLSTGKKIHLMQLLDCLPAVRSQYLMSQLQEWIRQCAMIFTELY